LPAIDVGCRLEEHCLPTITQVCIIKVARQISIGIKRYVFRISAICNSKRTKIVYLLSRQCQSADQNQDGQLGCKRHRNIIGDAEASDQLANETHRTTLTSQMTIDSIKFSMLQANPCSLVAHFVTGVIVLKPDGECRLRVVYSPATAPAWPYFSLYGLSGPLKALVSVPVCCQSSVKQPDRLVGISAW
jgi:hypothetical protein